MQKLQQRGAVVVVANAGRVLPMSSLRDVLRHVYCCFPGSYGEVVEV